MLLASDKSANSLIPEACENFTLTKSRVPVKNCIDWHDRAAELIAECMVNEARETEGRALSQAQRAETACAINR